MELEKFLGCVEEKHTEFLDSPIFLEEDIVNVREAARILCLAKSSKKIRSELVYHFGMFFAIEKGALIHMAAAAELIHMASLLHDDVIDMGIRRRGRPTANVIYGNTISILTGDLLYSQALEFLQGLDIKIFGEAIQVVKKMTIAASSESNQKGNLQVGMDTWHKIALGKTAALFAWCLSSPAMIHEAQEQEICLFKEVGHLLGKAFQLADDIKDFFPDEAFGKAAYSDIKNQNPNYILTMAVNHSEEFKEKVSYLWNKKDIENESFQKEIDQLGEIIYNSEFFQQSLVQLKSWIEQAVQTLKNNGYESLSQAVKNLVKKILFSMSEEVLSRFKGV